MKKKRSSKKRQSARSQNEISSVSRRMFLRGAGGFAMAIPFLPSLLPREAWGQQASTIRRYFTVVGSYDYGHHMHWFPTLNQLTNVQASANGDHTIRYQALNSFLQSPNQDLSRILGNGLNPVINKVNILRGLNLHTRIGHGRGHMLGNVQDTDGHDNQVNLLEALPTIDQVLATNRNFTPHTRDPLLLGAPWGAVYSHRRQADGSVSRFSGEWRRPHELYNRLFFINGQLLPENGGTLGTPPHPRRDALSRVLADYQRVRNGRQISSTDRQILDNAMDQMSDIRSRLNGDQQVASGCTHTNIDLSASVNVGVEARNFNARDYGAMFDLYARIFAAAASCDLHRVMGFHYLHLNGNYDRHPTEDFHQGHSHRPWEVVASNNNTVNHLHMANIHRGYVQNFVAPLARYLDGFQEANGRTILDNSLIHMAIESSTVHSDSNRPCLLIGGAGGNLTTGHMIDYSDRSRLARMQGDNFNDNPTSPQFGHCYKGAHYNRSLTTILRAMGLQPSEYENPNINGFFRNRSDGLIGAHNNAIGNVGGYGHIGSATSGVWYYTNQQLYDNEYAQHNYHFYKDSLPFPTESAV